MRILSIGSDRKIFEKGSSVRERMIEYGKVFDEYYIIVFSLKKHGLPKVDKLSSNVWAIPTNSLTRIDYMDDAVKIGKMMAGIDWVSAQDPFESGWAALRIASSLKSKLNIQIHTDFLNSYFWKGSILNFIRIFIAPFILKKANSVRVVSLRIKESVQKKYQLKVPIKVLPIYTDIKTLRLAPPKFDLHLKYPAFNKIILTTARLEKEKDLKLSLTIFKELLEKHPRLGFFIVGDGSMKKELISKAKSLKIDKNVIFAGWQNDTISYYKTADIYLSTSKYEGYGLSLIEASICGAPVVTTDVGVAGEILLNKINSMICPVGDKECLKGALQKLISNDKLYRQIKKNAKKISSSLPSTDRKKYLDNYKKSIIGK